MKQGFLRQHSRHRDRTPSVIYLPPPKPPMTPKRSLEVVKEAPLSPPPEATVSSIHEGSDLSPVQTHGSQGEPQLEPSSLNRQARRKALRAEAKALRRQGFAPLPVPQTQQAERAETVAKQKGTDAAAASAQQCATPDRQLPVSDMHAASVPKTPEDASVLSRSRSLVAPKPRGLALFVHKLGVIFGLRRAGNVPADPSMMGQLRALREDLATLQKAVDRMIDGVAA